jgi:hypothetical protein
MSSIVHVNGSEVSISVSSAAEAKLAIKELKLLKKGFALQKKEVAATIKMRRFDYSQEVKTRGSMVRGGGGLGRFFRGVQSISRDNKRAGLAKDLHPLESEKDRLDSVMNSIDQIIVKLEVYILSDGQS